MDNLKKYRLPILVLGSLASLAIGFRSFFMTNIIEPIAYLTWAVWRIVHSVNQNIYWIILIGICSFLVIRLVPSGNGKSPGFAYHYMYRSPNRVEYWRTLIKEAALGKDETGYLRDNLEKLLISVITKAERSSPINLEELVALGKTPLSPAARHFLFPPKEMGGAFSISRWGNIMFITPRWFRWWAGKFIRQDTTSIDEILKWMETEMEINHDK